MTIGGENSYNWGGELGHAHGAWQGPSRDAGEKRGGYLNAEQV